MADLLNMADLLGLLPGNETRYFPVISPSLEKKNRRWPLTQLRHGSSSNCNTFIKESGTWLHLWAGIREEDDVSESGINGKLEQLVEHAMKPVKHAVPPFEHTE